MRKQRFRLRMTVGTRLILFSALLLLIPSIVLTYISFVTAEKEITTQMELTASNAVNTINRSIGRTPYFLC